MNDGSMFASLRNFDNPEFGMSHVIEYNTIEGATGFGSYQLLGCWYEDLTTPNPYRYWDQVGELTEHSSATTLPTSSNYPCTRRA